MTTDVPTRRYAKGDAKRRQILEAALQVISERGYRNSSLQEIADSVDLTKAGVLHYFDSREDLLTQVLREKDQKDAELDSSDDLLALMRHAIQHNRDVPGLVQLYSWLAVESEDPAHPGHDYVGDRYATLARRLADSIRAHQDAGALRTDVDPLVWARILTAVSDGLQLQWLHDPDVDMAATYGAVMALLEVRPEP